MYLSKLTHCRRISLNFCRKKTKEAIRVIKPVNKKSESEVSKGGLSFPFSAETKPSDEDTPDVNKSLNAQSKGTY